MAAARGIASLEPTDLVEGNLTLPLGLSAWMRLAGLDLAEARDVLLILRSRLLETSGLDRASEPVPLLAGDERTAVLALAVYLEGLVARASRRAGTSREQSAELALAALDG